MSLTVNTRPSATFQGNTCKHSAVGNPILYKMTRKDYTTATIANSGGNLRITRASDLTAEIEVGDELYFRSDNGIYDDYYTVLTISYSAPDTTITFDGGYTAAGTTGFINLATRLNYKVEVEVWNNTGPELLGTFRVSPDSRGEVVIDVRRVLWANMTTVDGYNYTTSTEPLTGRYKNFYIKYTELWIGSANSATNDSANTFYGVYGARQIGSKYNGFLSDYACYETPSTELAKFLTPFTPAIWKTLPFAICHLSNYDHANSFLYKQVQKDASGATLATGTISSYTGAGAIHRVYSYITPYMYQNTRSAVLTIEDGTAGGTISKTLTVDVKEPCNQPVVLEWVNSLGGDSFWCFSLNQEYSYTYQDRRKGRRMVLFSDGLTLEQWEGINELNSAGDIYMNPVTELTTSVNRTSSIIGARVIMHDYRNTELTVLNGANSGGLIEFTCDREHNFSFVEDDLIFINSDFYWGYFYARPTAGQDTKFKIKSTSGANIAYTSTPTFVEARKVNPVIGVVVIANELTTDTKREKHSIQIEVELPEIFTT